MANVEKLSIALPKDMVDSIRDAVESGDYATTSEVIRDALRNWRQKTRQIPARVRMPKTEAELRRMIQKGIDSADRGDVKPAAEVFDRLEAKYRALAKAQKGKAKVRR
jgi:antitoxin ParD1/3/4